MTTTTAGLGTRTAHDPGDPLITSHCPFCGSGQVVGRSDGTIGCGFCGQNYIVRVQPAFPGMPQMPSGPGAPSDIGPDGGLADPGMIGPDGLPAGGAPLPGDEDGEDEEDGEDGGPPFGDEDGGSSSPPPSSGGKNNDSKKSDKKKPPPGPKKGSARRYRGFTGQALTEDQFIRHMAVALSGASPAVMARLRSDRAAGRPR